jgi:hypothetical protein
MDPQSYGAGLNAIGGGVYAMEWTSDWIRVWFFPRTQIPASINAGTPNMTDFGTPRANFEFLAVNDTNTNCTVDKSFAHHQIIFDTVSLSMITIIVSILTISLDHVRSVGGTSLW